ncbi:hypothetical protein B0T14DRAFT_517987 [Immersiella caudata]|uniref:Uncharacterized protein n=1 Tax=Immersiella caudata TaxID=314043 RepID=A0AA40C3V3_9PEZI|nr:hypothetical protein B0T14DRAFT_517987 [Immersiella caudata]
MACERHCLEDFWITVHGMSACDHCPRLCHFPAHTGICLSEAKLDRVLGTYRGLKKGTRTYA